MARFDDLLQRGTSVARLLRVVGMRQDFIRTDRAFASAWAWDDGNSATITVWRDEVHDLDGEPWITIENPAGRVDLVGQRKVRAQHRYDVLVNRNGQPVRAIIQTKQQDPARWSSGVTDKRGVDNESWTPTLYGNSVTLRRGASEEMRQINLDGNPMPVREPVFSLHEVRPHQMRFRDLVAAKTGNRCALTGAPCEVCEAAHFAWVDWRNANETHDGVFLRRDLHAALDRGLIAIDPDGRVTVSQYLAACSDEYRSLHGQSVPV